MLLCRHPEDVRGALDYLPFNEKPIANMELSTGPKLYTYNP
jgi:hypothetical protein